MKIIHLKINRRRIFFNTCILFLLTLVTGFSYGQGLAIKGDIIDIENSEPLVGATVIAQMIEDTSIVYYTTANSEGEFNIRVAEAGEYRVEVNFLGYRPNSFNSTITASTNSLNDYHIKLRKRIFLIDEVEIVKTQNRILIKEDTVEYSASAYKVNPDATVGDLISKMPGITVEDDKVTAYGEEVVKILIDGEEFFSDDPGIALNVLPSDVVDKVEVIDKKSEQSEFTGFDDGNSYKTINIKTKGGGIKGKFGNFYAGAGEGINYNVGTNVHSFNKSRRLSLIASSNNINQQEFFKQDNMGMAESAGGDQGGIKTTNSIGLNLNDKWGENWTVSGSYFYNHIANEDETYLDRTYYLPESSISSYDESGSNDGKNQNHRLNMRLENDINSSNSILISPSFSFQDFYSAMEEDGNSYSLDGEYINSMENKTENQNQGYNFSNSILLRHKFGKRGRTLSVSLDGSVNNTDTKKINNSNTEYFQTGESEIINQERTTENSTKRISTNLSYTEALGSKSLLLLSYEGSIDNNYSDLETNEFDSEIQTYSLIDSSLTGTSKHNTYTQKANVGYRLNLGRDLHFSLATALKHVLLEGEQDYSEYTDTRMVFNALEPRVDLNYSKNNRINIKLSYDGQGRIPNVSDLYDIIDNSNPLRISQGNPDLTPEYTHSLRSNWRFSNAAFTSFLMLNLEAKLSDKYICNNTVSALSDTTLSDGTILHAGSSYTKPINTSGYRRLSAQTTYSFPWTVIRSNLSVSTGINYSQTPTFLNEDKYFSNNTTSTSSISITSNISDKIDFNISYRANYSMLRYTIQSTDDQDYYQGSLSSKLYIMPIYRVVFTTDFSLVHYSGLKLAEGESDILWNGALAYKFLKHNKGELKLSVYDLLNSRLSVKRNTNTYYVEDSESKVLTQYIMLTFTYKLRDIELNI